MLYQNICVFPCISHRFFVPLYLLTIHVHLWTKLFKLCKFISLTNNHYATKPLFNYGPHWARPTLFPQHSAANRLAETPRSSCRRSASWAPHETQASHLPPGRSKHYLPTSRAAMSCLFRSFSASESFLSPNSDFPYLKPGLSSKESSVLQRGVSSIILQTSNCKYFYQNSNLCGYALMHFRHLHSEFLEIWNILLYYNIYYYNNIYYNIKVQLGIIRIKNLNVESA